MAGRRRPLSLLFGLLMLLAAGCIRQPAQVEDASGARMALVPAGEFALPADYSPVSQNGERTVFVDSFYLDLYEVTNQHYAACVNAGECSQPENTVFYADAAYANHPVVFVTWDMAQTYCQWRGARLPTRSEWEKAAAEELAGVEYFWGDASPVCQFGARLGAGIEPDAELRIETQPVGSQAPNSFGLYDMTGSQWEWVQDRFEEQVYLSPPATVSFLRMASWSGYGPVYRRFLCSFRCAASP